MTMGWFAEPQYPYGGSVGIKWMPCLRLGRDLVAEIHVMFDSKEACELWLLDNVVGKTWPLTDERV